jgi:predicted acetyltransferase
MGIIDIRHSLSEKYYYSGHIGYSIRPSLRGKGYGTEMLRLGLEKAKELKIKKVLLTCKKSNIASQKVIERNKGVLEKEIFEDGEAYLVYWICV